MDRPGRIAAVLHRAPSRAQIPQARHPGLWRAAWVGVVVPAYAVLLSNIPAYVASLHHPSTPTSDAVSVRPTLADADALGRLGFSLDDYAAWMLGVTLLFEVCYAGVGLLLFIFRSGNRAALLCSFALMLLPLAFANSTVPEPPLRWPWLVPLLGALANASLLLCALVFPDGRIVPRWARWSIPFVLGFWILVGLVPSWALDRSWVSTAIFVCLEVGALLVQVYRYRADSSPSHRQQTKWAVYGIAIAVAGNVVVRALYVLVLLPHGGIKTLAFAAEVALVMLSMMAIPLTVGIAILSARLWDVDVVINRTLVYGSLTALLTGIYAASVVILQSIMHAITGHGQDSALAIVVSTLLIAALVRPLRQRIQRTIDRRFYHRKYDAARTVERFAATLHHQVELDQLTSALVSTVDDVMQPTSISLWLPPRTRDRPLEKGGLP